MAQTKQKFFSTIHNNKIVWISIEPNEEYSKEPGASIPRWVIQLCFEGQEWENIGQAYTLNDAHDRIKAFLGRNWNVIQ